jgi:uncharacterized protein
MMLRSLIGGALLTAGLMLAGGVMAGTGPEPSFSCANVKGIEAAICTDVELATYDREMAELYKASQRAAVGDAPSRIQVSQREWLKDRNETCAAPSEGVTACLRDRYRERLHELARSAMFTVPDKAFAVLKTVDPQVEPIYRAMYLYATIDDPKARAAAVTPLITPYYQSRGKEHGVEPVSPPAQAVASDEAFGDFVSVIWLIGDLPEIRWPCGVLARRPGLIDSIHAYWGSGADLAIPTSDCANMTTDIPGLHALIAEAWKAAPPCDASMRFAYYLSYEQLETAVVLHRPSVWKEPADKTSKGTRAFRTKNAQAIGQVQKALADYYVTTFQVEPVLAEREATGAVDHLVTDLFYSCDG